MRCIFLLVFQQVSKKVLSIDGHTRLRHFLLFWMKPKDFFFNSCVYVIVLLAAAPDDHLITEPPEAFAADALTDATHPTTRERKQRSWKASQQKCEENWASKRRLLIDTAIEMLAPSSNFCWKCSAFYREVIRCHYCGPQTYFCSTSFADCHRHTRLHFSEIWTVRTKFVCPFSSFLLL
ncbi:hypothetical protein BaRGS_00033828 [Batillaria attramentaria]|uniref:C2H2-type domain-containing protein n=1 Tax=Batillaria attramentaria TaxID=370345 RepID=A0ABD0JJ29_9CAEN